MVLGLNELCQAPLEKSEKTVSELQKLLYFEDLEA